MYVLDRNDFDDALDAVSHCDIDVREDYSGRGMYGSTCLGIVCDVGDFAQFCAAVGTSDLDPDFLADTRTDSMGRSTIYYWPGTVLADAAPVDEEEVTTT